MTIRSKAHVFILLTIILAVYFSGCASPNPPSHSPAISESPAPTAPPSVRPQNQMFYVSPTGDDANPGTREKPWATPGFGSRQLAPGDTLIILGGKYVLKRYDDDVIKPGNGTSAAWITIKGEEGDRPVLAGRDNLLDAVELAGDSYIKIENLEITHDNTASGEGVYFRDGIELTYTPASHIILKDLYIHHIDEMGVNIQDVDKLEIINCSIEYTGAGAIGGPTPNYSGIRDLLVKDCRLAYSGHYYQGTDGANRPYDRPDGLGFEPSDGPIGIINTTSEHNLGDGLDSKIAHTFISNCIVANNACDGVKLWADGGRVENTLIYGTGDGKGGGSPWAGLVIDDPKIRAGSRFEIVNVAIHDSPQRVAYPIYIQYEGGMPITVLMRNTIVANGHGEIYIGNNVTFIADHDIFYRPDEAVQVHIGEIDYNSTQVEGGEIGEGNLCRDPMFMAPAWGMPGDYRLKDGSPAIDAGTSNGAPNADLDGKARPQGSGYDIGPYER